MGATDAIFTFQGASAERYRFFLINPDDAKTWPNSGGVVAFAEYTPAPLWFGATNNIHDYLAGEQYWGHARIYHNATLIYAHFLGDKNKRRMIAGDLIEQYKPQMNLEF